MHRRTFIFQSSACVVGSLVAGRSIALAAIDTSGMNGQEFLEFRMAINRDYAEGNVDLADGWIVSKTELKHPGAG